MRRFTMNALIIAVPFILLAGCSSETDEPAQQGSEPVRIDLSQETGYFGWDTANIRNSYISLDVLPEFGGRIMGYSVFGSKMLWHDATHEGEIGEFNPGGAWVVPAGAELGDWPSPAMSPFETMVYETSLTDASFSMSGSADGYRITADGDLEPLSTIVRQRYTLERTASGVDGPSGLRQVISIPVDGDVMVYAPVTNGGWRVIAGGEDNPQWLGVDDGLFRARYDRRYGRVGLKLREGWIAWRNADNGMAFVIQFPVDAGTYPGGYQVEIRTLGDGNGPGGPLAYSQETARMEIVLMSRLENLDPGDTLTMNTRWESSHASDIVAVLPQGILSQEFGMREGRFTGKFGVFRSGMLQYVYVDADKEVFGRRNMFEITPLSEVVVDHGFEYFTFPETLKYLRFQTAIKDRDDIQQFGEIGIDR